MSTRNLQPCSSRILRGKGTGEPGAEGNSWMCVSDRAPARCSLLAPDLEHTHLPTKYEAGPTFD